MRRLPVILSISVAAIVACSEGGAPKDSVNQEPCYRVCQDVAHIDSCPEERSLPVCISDCRTARVEHAGCEESFDNLLGCLRSSGEAGCVEGKAFLVDASGACTAPRDEHTACVAASSPP